MGKAIYEFIKSIWSIFNNPNNEPIIVGLLIALFALLFAYVTNYLSFRARLKDKDKQIEDLVEQRNKLLEIAFQLKGITRKSSKK